MPHFNEARGEPSNIRGQRRPSRHHTEGSPKRNSNYSMLKKLLLRIVPIHLLERFRPLWNEFKRRRFLAQGRTQLEAFGIVLDLPAQHPLPGLIATHPYRDLCIGVVAKFMSQKYPSETIIDIGANIGDTAAIIAENCKNPLVLVEGSDFYFDYLTVNATRLRSPTVLRRILISDGRPMYGELQHWGGTAEIKPSAAAPPVETVRLCDITSCDVCFVKSDTDGHDFKILLAALDWLESQMPALLFESQIRDADDLAAANSLIEGLFKAGYRHFVVWDAAGYHLLSTSDTSAVDGLHRYVMKVVTAGVAGNVCNLDVACFHGRDLDVFEQTAEWYRHY
jgi:FkbM family methyltransferase